MLTDPELEELALPQRMPTHEGLRVLPMAIAFVRERALGQIGEDLVAVLRRRDEIGATKYGGGLRTNNGRSAAVDAAQEAFDLFMYATQGQLEAEVRQDLTDSAIWGLLQRRALDAALQAMSLRLTEGATR